MSSMCSTINHYCKEFSDLCCYNRWIDKPVNIIKISHDLFCLDCFKKVSCIKCGITAEAVFYTKGTKFFNFFHLKNWRSFFIIEKVKEKKKENEKNEKVIFFKCIECKEKGIVTAFKEKLKEEQPFLIFDYKNISKKNNKNSFINLPNDCLEVIFCFLRFPKCLSLISILCLSLHRFIHHETSFSWLSNLSLFFQFSRNKKDIIKSEGFFEKIMINLLKFKKFNSLQFLESFSFNNREFEVYENDLFIIFHYLKKNKKLKQFTPVNDYTDFKFRQLCFNFEKMKVCKISSSKLSYTERMVNLRVLFIGRDERRDSLTDDTFIDLDLSLYPLLQKLVVKSLNFNIIIGNDSLKYLCVRNTKSSTININWSIIETLKLVAMYGDISQLLKGKLSNLLCFSSDNQLRSKAFEGMISHCCKSIERITLRSYIYGASMVDYLRKYTFVKLKILKVYIFMKEFEELHEFLKNSTIIEVLCLQIINQKDFQSSYSNKENFKITKDVNWEGIRNLRFLSIFHTRRDGSVSILFKRKSISSLLKLKKLKKLYLYSKLQVEESSSEILSKHKSLEVLFFYGFEKEREYSANSHLTHLLKIKNLRELHTSMSLGQLPTEKEKMEVVNLIAKSKISLLSVYEIPKDMVLLLLKETKLKKLLIYVGMKYDNREFTFLMRNQKEPFKGEIRRKYYRSYNNFGYVRKK